MKTVFLIIGVALFVIGLQDAIRLLANNNSSSVFGFIPGSVTVHVAIGVAVAIIGAVLARYAKKAS